MRYDDPNVPASAVVGIIGAILLFAIIVALQALFYSFEEQELQRKVYGQPYEALQQLDADQVEQLNSYGWISEPDGVAHIPIERAMELTVEELAQE
jgi:FlaG/FlaF family flagellin (archaellin)